MQVTGPTPVTFVPTSTTLIVNSIAFDMNGKTYSIQYGDLANSTSGTLTGAIPAPLYTQLQTTAQRAIEIKIGWANGSTTAT